MNNKSEIRVWIMLISIALLILVSSVACSNNTLNNPVSETVVDNINEDITRLKEATPIKISPVDYSGMTHREFILSSYPQFEEEGIDLQLRNSFQYGGLYIYPKTIIIKTGDVKVGSALLKQRVEHELTHYFLRMKYNNLDYENHHKRIKDGEYMLR